MLMPSGPSASKLSLEVGIGQPTLSRWLREATTLDPVTKRRKRAKQVSVTSPVQRRSDERSPEEKLRLVLEAGGLADADLGEFLRRNGIHEIDLAAWREAALGGLGVQARAATRSSDARRLRELEKELRRKDKALAETAALFVLPPKKPVRFGGRGRRHETGEQRVILALIEEAVAAGARRSAACAIVNLSKRAVERWRAQDGGEDRRAGPVTATAHKLSGAERAEALTIANWTSPIYAVHDVEPSTTR
jgi:transposase